MRVRIKQDEEYDNRWIVEVKQWWTGWEYKASFFGDTAKERAISLARNTLYPVIVEVKK